MARVVFASVLQRHVACPPADEPGRTVREVLDKVFAGNERARRYVLDDQGALRKHMVIFVDGQHVRDRIHLSDTVADNGQIYVLQSLSGG
jgi:hypothetical protein